MQYLVEWGELFFDQRLYGNLQNSSLYVHMWIGGGHVAGLRDALKSSREYLLVLLEKVLKQ